MKNELKAHLIKKKDIANESSIFFPADEGHEEKLFQSIQPLVKSNEPCIFIDLDNKVFDYDKKLTPQLCLRFDINKINGILKEIEEFTNGCNTSEFQMLLLRYCMASKIDVKFIRELSKEWYYGKPEAELHLKVLRKLVFFEQRLVSLSEFDAKCWYLIHIVVPLLNTLLLKFYGIPNQFEVVYLAVENAEFALGSKEKARQAFHYSVVRLFKRNLNCPNRGSTLYVEPTRRTKVLMDGKVFTYLEVEGEEFVLKSDWNGHT